MNIFTFLLLKYPKREWNMEWVSANPNINMKFILDNPNYVQLKFRINYIFIFLKYKNKLLKYAPSGARTHDLRFIRLTL